MCVRSVTTGRCCVGRWAAVTVTVTATVRTHGRHRYAAIMPCSAGHGQWHRQSCQSQDVFKDHRRCRRAAIIYYDTSIACHCCHCRCSHPSPSPRVGARRGARRNCRMRLATRTDTPLPSHHHAAAAGERPAHALFTAASTSSIDRPLSAGTVRIIHHRRLPLHQQTLPCIAPRPESRRETKIPGCPRPHVDNAA
ncbi:hypothetical protein CC80DRAFT_45372 [Byssothecium circinans]|uniref:Uncharacterized protein n=1 Tax=Byssothecium circinans TaxID=147558 RepID=A0A6A5TZJ1_9PLEO|nr:hypothetical protein CC80DRAFT_45372 [Byssothecium circinans]